MWCYLPVPLSAPYEYSSQESPPVAKSLINMQCFLCWDAEAKVSRLP